MNFDTWLLYVGTVLIFMISPGPSHQLMISVGITNGFKKSLATAAGDLSANAIQIVLAGFGLAALITSSRYGFVLIKWTGVAYLIWVGFKTIRASFSKRSNTPTSMAPLTYFLTRSILSASSPHWSHRLGSTSRAFMGYLRPMPPYEQK